MDPNEIRISLKFECRHGPAIEAGDQVWCSYDRRRSAHKCAKDIPIARFSIEQHMKLMKNLQKIKSAKTDERIYCHTCRVVFVSGEQNHTDHKLTTKLSIDMVENPSKLLKPFNDNKKEAQYFFSPDSTACLTNIINQNNFKYVLCIGTPSIHEFIRKKYADKIVSLLLDIDERYYNFFSANEFCHYNMFNHHFFNKESEINFFHKFLIDSHNNVCVIIDPPFGGRIELFKNTLKNITQMYEKLNENTEINDILPTILVLPYFMEPQINNHISSLIMSDYQITYVNHASFKSKKSSKNGSPIRFYTNISLKKIILPESEGYKFCEKCHIWVGKWNIHCSKCAKCCSKSGITYNHCDECKKCVKPSWRHCAKCKRCCLIDHMCEHIPFTQKCFNCQQYGHKKKDCPHILNENKTKRKKSCVSNTEKFKPKKIKNG